jgi:hypothetical protein
MPPAPKAGVCPLPVLPALPTYREVAFFAKTDVPHGKVQQATYENYTAADKRRHIYLPPDYDSNAAARNPVLYLNHGGGGDDANWTAESPKGGGSAQFILDNLIAAAKAKPMIMVMPDTHGCASGTPSAPGNDDVYARVSEGHHPLRGQLSAQAAAWAPNPMNPPKFFDLPANGEIRPLIAAKWVTNSLF